MYNKLNLPVRKCVTLLLYNTHLNREWKRRGDDIKVDDILLCYLPKNGVNWDAASFCSTGESSLSLSSSSSTVVSLLSSAALLLLFSIIIIIFHEINVVFYLVEKTAHTSNFIQRSICTYQYYYYHHGQKRGWRYVPKWYIFCTYLVPPQLKRSFLTFVRSTL